MGRLLGGPPSRISLPPRWSQAGVPETSPGSEFRIAIFRTTYVGGMQILVSNWAALDSRPFVEAEEAPAIGGVLEDGERRVVLAECGQAGER